MADATPQDEQLQLRHLLDELHSEFPTLSADDVDQQFDLVVHRFDQASVRTFIPVLVRRGALAQLRGHT